MNKTKKLTFDSPEIEETSEFKNFEDVSIRMILIAARRLAERENGLNDVSKAS